MIPDNALQRPPLCIQPGNPVPGPKEKGTPAFAARTVPLEKAAKAQFEAKGSLRPFAYTAHRPVEEGRLQVRGETMTVLGKFYYNSVTI